MRKLTQKNYINIIAITSATLQQYTDFCLRCAKDTDNTAEDNAMHIEDILYMQTALNNFIKDKNVEQLQDKIMWQDTFVREYFVDTLQYLEDELLVSNCYCS
jgi:1,2-phenylacetyl-CoA epoxidase catalytic subunit